MSYDESCETLARNFLDDEFAALDRAHYLEKVRLVDLHAPKLAQVIQDAIESYLQAELRIVCTDCGTVAGAEPPPEDWRLTDHSHALSFTTWHCADCAKRCRESEASQ